MKRIIIASLLLLLIALLMPLLFVSAGFAKTDSPENSSAPEASAPPLTGDALTTPSPPGPDGDYRFTALVAGRAEVFNMRDYLPGVLAGEMPASFETEALRAQAVAARTYIMYAANRINPRHPEAAVCDDPACCKAYITTERMRQSWGGSFDAYYKKLSEAASDTDGEYITYGGEPILAAFHSSSAGKTENSGAVWNPVPYLVAVDSPETAADVPGYISSAEVTADDFKSGVLGEYPDADLSGAPETWLGETEKNDSGRTGDVVIGGVRVSGARLRVIFALRSTAFDVAYTDGRFVFSVTGYGHGVGMSQFGANVMAKAGSDYRDILAHYYPGTALTTPSGAIAPDGVV